MIKKFFIAMLGTMAGLWLSLLIIVCGVMLMVGKFVSENLSTSAYSDQILYVLLKGEVEEYPTSANVQSLLSLGEEHSSSFSEIISAIDLARTDKKVKGIYLDCAGAELGVASRGELIGAIEAFKESGKWVYAYADNYTQGDYYIASCADRVFLNPVGMIDVHGLCSQVLFFQDVMKKLGVSVDVVKVGTFKSAVEPFIRMDMSEANRKQTQIFLNSLWGSMSAGIAENRGLASPSVVNGWADDMFMTWDPKRYLEQKAVTQLAYRTEVEEILRKEMGIKKADQELPFVSVGEYMTVNASEVEKTDKPHIAVLFAAGDISDTGDEGITSEAMVPLITELTNDENVKGLVLRVNSGGGSAFASEQIWKALEDFKATGKPFYVSMGDVAASGGYYISCGADKIYCDATTITGSIGIFGVIPNAQTLLRDKIGLGIDTVSTGPNSLFPSIYHAPTSGQIAAMQKYVERGYETFVGRVAQGRDIPVDSVKVIGEGRVWDGKSALKIGLVDEIGGLRQAFDAMAENLGMKGSDVAYYPKYEATALDMLMSLSSGKISVEVCGLPVDDECVRALKQVKDICPMQARMEKIIIK